MSDMPKKKLPDMGNWTNRQIAEFWATHDSADYWDDMEDTDEIEFVRPNKPAIALRLDESDIERIKSLADKQGIGYTTLIRMWLKEKLATVETV